MALLRIALLVAVKALAVLFTPLSVSAAHAGEYTAIAWSADGKSWAWTRRESQKEANRVAVSLCNQDATLKDCKLTVTRAVVKAKGGNHVAIATSQVSLKHARAEAVDACRAPQCKPVDEFTQPGFIAVARTKNPDSDAHFFVAYGYRNSDKADEEAKNGCEKLAGEACRVWFSGSIPGNVDDAPTAAVKPTARKVAHTQNCRPTTPSVRCSSQCVNGDCVVTYENGCKMRVQVSPRFDSFSSQWTYPSPRC